MDHAQLTNVHHIATKTWSLLGETLTGSIKSLLVLSSPGGLLQFTEVIVKEVCDTLVILRGHVIGDEAERHRQVVLELFAPKKERRKAHSLVHVLSAFLFNADWRKDRPTHICNGCCSSEAETIGAAKKYLPKLVSALRFKMFSRADWSQWANALGACGLLMQHA